MPAFTPPPPAPQRGDRATFSQRVDNFLTWLVTLIPQFNTFEANLNAIAAGGANTFPYNFDSSVADSDPGPGKIRFNSSTQNAASIIRLDPISSGNVDISGVLNSLLAGTSTVKGSLRIQKASDVSSWLLFDITGSNTASGYTNLVVTFRAGSSTSPFSNGDSVAIFFDKSGDRGNAVTQQDIQNAIDILPIQNGGTASNTASGALSNLGGMPISGGTFGGQVMFQEGSAIDPGIGFVNDGAPDTGFYHRADGQFSVTCNSTRTVDYSSYRVNIYGIETVRTEGGNGSQRVLFRGEQGNGALRFAFGLNDDERPVMFNYDTSGNFNGAIYYGSGNINATGAITGTNVTSTSDETLKDSWESYDTGVFERFAAMEKVGKFRWKSNDQYSLGVGAQSFREILPEAVHEDISGTLSVNASGASLVLLHAMAKELLAIREKINSVK